MVGVNVICNICTAYVALYIGVLFFSLSFLSDSLTFIAIMNFFSFWIVQKCFKNVQVGVKEIWGGGNVRFSGVLMGVMCNKNSVREPHCIKGFYWHPFVLFLKHILLNSFMSIQLLDLLNNETKQNIRVNSLMQFNCTAFGLCQHKTVTATLLQVKAHQRNTKECTWDMHKAKPETFSQLKWGVWCAKVVIQVIILSGSTCCILVTGHCHGYPPLCSVLHSYILLWCLCKSLAGIIFPLSSSLWTSQLCVCCSPTNDAFCCFGTIPFCKHSTVVISTNKFLLLFILTSLFLTSLMQRQKTVYPYMLCVGRGTEIDLVILFALLTYCYSSGINMFFSLFGQNVTMLCKFAAILVQWA